MIISVVEWKKLLGSSPPFLYLQKYDIFTYILQKRPSPTNLVASFRETYAWFSRKCVSTEHKARSFQ